MPTIDSRVITTIGTDAGETVVANFTGPIAPDTTYNLTFNFNGNGGDDRFTFKLADYALTSGEISGNFKGGAGVDTFEIDLDGATEVTSSATYAGTTLKSVSYGFVKDGLYGTFTADSTVERMVIKGTAADETYYGSAGDDWFDGRGGADTFFGSAGNDGYVITSAGAYVVGEKTGGGTDTIWSTVSIDLREQGAVENLRLMETGANPANAIGNQLANLITGNSADNIIAGGTGVDKLYGKGGADTFYFAEKGAANRDTIFDFDDNDHISLSSSAFGGLASVGGVLADSAFSTTGASGASAQILYNKTTGIVSYDVDGAGSAAAVDVASIGKNLAFVDASDFLIVA